MKYLFIAIILLFTYCSENETDKQTKDLLIQQKAKEISDNIIINAGKEDFDKAKSLKDSCPVKINKIEIVDKDNSLDKKVRIKFKNSTQKPIDAIKFIVSGENNWGEPEVINVIISSAFTYCEIQETIAGGESKSGLWSLDSRKVTKVKAEVTKIHFVDGEVWDINSK